MGCAFQQHRRRSGTHRVGGARVGGFSAGLPWRNGCTVRFGLSGLVGCGDIAVAAADDSALRASVPWPWLAAVV